MPNKEGQTPPAQVIAQSGEELSIADKATREDHEKVQKGSLRGKIKRAGWDDAYLARFLTLF